MATVLRVLIETLDILVIATLAVVAAAEVRHRWLRMARRPVRVPRDEANRALPPPVGLAGPEEMSPAAALCRRDGA